MLSVPERIDQCILALDGKEGVDDARALCTWMEQQGMGLPGSGGSVEAAVAAAGSAAFRNRANMENHDEIDQGKRDQGAPASKEDAGPGAPDPGDSMRSPMRASLDLRFSTPFTAEIAPTSSPIQKAFPKARTVVLKGTFIDTSRNENRWGVPSEELASIARQLASGTVQVRVDHADEVRSVLGLYDGATLMDAPAPAMGEPDLGRPIPLNAPAGELARAMRVDFSARITTEDAALLTPILMGYVKGVSPNVTAKHVECGVCGKAALPMPACAHFDTPEAPGWHLLRGVGVVEGSIVAKPAYAGTPFIPVGFAAGLTRKSEEMRHLAESAAQKAGASAGDERVAVLNERLELERERRTAAEERATKFEARLAALEARPPAAGGDPNAAGAAKKAAAEEAASEEDAAEEEPAPAAAKATAKAKAKPPTLDERVAATRQGAKAGTETPAGSQAPRRPWGAMAGSLHSEAGAASDFKAMQELQAAHDGRLPLNRFFNATPPGFEVKP